jgi:hypothetical protein
MIQQENNRKKVAIFLFFVVLTGTHLFDQKSKIGRNLHSQGRSNRPAFYLLLRANGLIEKL